MKTFIKAILGGFSISLGGIIYLTMENHIVGAFLFSI
jgi:formate/nitrite transporter FocA (FNT family)